MREVEQHLLVAFYDLFSGNSAGYGKHKYAGNKWKKWTNKGAVKLIDYAKHLDGQEGLGIVPIKSGSVCSYSCIDWDEHKKTGIDADLIALSTKIAEMELPLIACRSKSGGAHIYGFYDTPMPATKCRQLMIEFAKRLDIYSTSEIFPKQSQIRDGQCGSTLDLPYYDHSNTQRFAVVDSRVLNLQEFIRTASLTAITEEYMDEYLGGEHKDAPPCLQHIITHGTDKGQRNEAVYNLTLYLRKRFPNDYRDKIYDMNHVVFHKPLQIKELRRTVTSASKKDYHYRCNESPCKDFCDKEACLDREYGIKPDDEMCINDAVFSRLKKYQTDPVQWEIGVQQFTVSVNTMYLMDYKKLREAIAEATTILIPHMRNEEWLRVLQGLMENAEVVDAPSDATTGGIILYKLREYLKKARVPQAGDSTDTAEARSPLLRGCPVLEKDKTHTKMIAHFSGVDFIEFLKRSRVGNHSPSAVWNTLRVTGVRNGRVRVGKRVIPVWSVQADIDSEYQVTPVFKTDF